MTTTSCPHTWRYRDYVIESFNEDVAFDRFIAEQLAGDLLPAEKPGEINRRGIIATGFLAVGPKPLVQQDKVKLKYDVVDEQIDTTSKAFLGLTIACAPLPRSQVRPDFNQGLLLFGVNLRQRGELRGY